MNAALEVPTEHESHEAKTALRLLTGAPEQLAEHRGQDHRR